MEGKTPIPQSKLKKRPVEELYDDSRQTKRSSPMGKEDYHNYQLTVRENPFDFRVLLPNGTTLPLRFHATAREMLMEDFVERLKEAYDNRVRVSEIAIQKRSIRWDSGELRLVDVYENEIRRVIDLNNFEPNKCHILRLEDGYTSGERITYENMWDLTPDTDLLRELPEEYNFETALADLIDNSLQAVWSNGPRERRLISVRIDKEKIRIFDTGPGMDGSPENSIVKWGKIGASMHRRSRGKAIGARPPYLMPVFGMYGYGGPFASMHLGRRALVSSKTKKSKKVYELEIERESLISSRPENTWKTKGGLRNPRKSEMEESPHRSFTMVEIFEPSKRRLDVKRLQCRLKDIYFPYIQCDELSETGETATPVEFQVNGTDLAEIESGEAAVTNLLSCNGPDFTFLLHFSQDKFSTTSPGLRESVEANARLKCIYFPIIQGKERIEMILEKLELDGCGVQESFTNFSRVSVRRLGRLLPDARWACLPFMEPKLKRGTRAQIMKGCCSRIKCFIDTDSGFNPTPSKTNLAHHHAFTVALKNFGGKFAEKETDVRIKIVKDGREIDLSKLEKQYHEWVAEMHEKHDKEIESGQDEAIHVIGIPNKEKLHISSDVARVYERFQRKGKFWKSGQKIKILKGACVGLHKANICATLEYIIIEGFEGDAGSEAHLICRPMGIPESDGCLLADNNGNPGIDIRESISVPISVIDSGKCVPVDDSEWDQVLQMRNQKKPSFIDLLSGKDCQFLGVEGELSFDIVDAGFTPPNEIVAVVRPASFDVSVASKSLDQKYIATGNFTMNVEIRFKAEISKKIQTDENVKKLFCCNITPVSRKGYHGLYMFSLRKELPKIFQEAGQYTFLFSLAIDNQKDLSCVSLEKSLRVRALSEVSSWQLLEGQLNSKLRTRIGSCFPCISIGSCDRYKNRNPVPPDTKVKVALKSSNLNLNATVKSIKQCFSSDNYSLTIKDMLVESNELDKIRPEYDATLSLASCDGSLSVSIPCQVMPGAPKKICILPSNFGGKLLPGQIIQNLVLELACIKSTGEAVEVYIGDPSFHQQISVVSCPSIFDACGNHAKQDECITLKADGFCMHDKSGLQFKVDFHGRVDLSGLLRVSEGYGKKISFSISSNDDVIHEREFQTEIRKLRAAFQVPIYGAAGTQLENIAFEVVNENGEVDDSIHNDDSSGRSHTITLRSDTSIVDDSLRYSFQRGRCCIRRIYLPEREGIFFFEATHSHYPELHFNVEVHVEQALYHEKENVPCQSKEEKNLLFQHTSGLGASRLECDDSSDKSSRGWMSLTADLSTPSNMGRLIKCVKNDNLQELEDDLCQYGVSIKEHEKNMYLLSRQLSEIKQEIALLQADLDLDYDRYGEDTTAEELFLEKISYNCYGSAGAVICTLLVQPKLESDLKDHILGIVASLGTVRKHDLSRIFSQYLGQDQMLAIVCKSHAYAATLEKYEPDGQVNNSDGLHGLAAALGMSIDRPFTVICLAGIRPYSGEVGSDPQRKLVLQDPVLPNGNPPPGYLGYAVNMIDLCASHWNWRTRSGHGLRETLFYLLFAETQVYQSRKDMHSAKAWIKGGAAMSLDGGIIRGNGVMTLGQREPDVQFPVVSLENQIPLSPRRAERLKLIEVKKIGLRETYDQLETEKREHENVMKKFKKDKEIYTKILEEKESLHLDSKPKLATDGP